MLFNNLTCAGGQNSTEWAQARKWELDCSKSVSLFQRRTHRLCPVDRTDAGSFAGALPSCQAYRQAFEALPTWSARRLGLEADEAVGSPPWRSFLSANSRSAWEWALCQRWLPGGRGKQKQKGSIRSVALDGFGLLFYFRDDLRRHGTRPLTGLSM